MADHEETSRIVREAAFASTIPNWNGRVRSAAAGGRRRRATAARRSSTPIPSTMTTTSAAACRPATWWTSPAVIDGEGADAGRHDSQRAWLRDAARRGRVPRSGCAAWAPIAPATSAARSCGTRKDSCRTSATDSRTGPADRRARHAPGEDHDRGRDVTMAVPLLDGAASSRSATRRPARACAPSAARTSPGIANPAFRIEVIEDRIAVLQPLRHRHRVAHPTRRREAGARSAC